MVQIVISEERGVRFLHFGSRWVQGAMRIARPYSLELEYTREMMLPLLLRPEAHWPASVLQVGLGSGSITKYLHRFRHEARVTVVEIAPDVVTAAYQFFNLPEESRRLRIEIGDGHEFVMASGRRFDLIVVDGFDPKGRAGMLESLPFYLNCRARLAARGMIAVNLLSRSRGHSQSAARLREAFEGRALVLPPSEPGNLVALAAVGPVLEERIQDLRGEALRLKAQTGLDLRPTLARLAAAHGPVLRL
jgi:spermidine synthase